MQTSCSGISLGNVADGPHIPTRHLHSRDRPGIESAPPARLPGGEGCERDLGRRWPVILRLVRGRVAVGDVPHLLAALRARLRPTGASSDQIPWVVGLRHAADDVGFLGLSAWPDVDDLRRFHGGDLGSLSQPGLEEFIDDVAISHFEDVGEPGEGDSSTGLDMGAGAIGILAGSIRPNDEPVVHDMIRGVRQQVAAAGVSRLRVGQRIGANGAVEIAVVAFWTDRSRLRSFARDRAEVAVDPAFTSHLTAWSFETYACLGPDRFRLEPSGPAVLVTDRDGWCNDASAGVEAVLGVPGELIVHRRLADVVDEPELATAALDDLATSGTAAGMLELALPGGRIVEVRYRAAVDRTAADRHHWVLELPGRVHYDRPIHEIAADALSSPDDRISSTDDRISSTDDPLLIEPYRV